MLNRKILQLIPELDGGGGAQKVVIDLYHLFSKMGFESHLSDFDPQIENPTNYREEFKANFHYVGDSTSKTPIRRFLLRCNAFKKIVQNQKADFVVSHMNGGHLINLLSRHSAKKILVLHGSVLHDGDTKLSGFLLRLLYVFLTFRMANKIVCVSEEIRAELASKFLISKSRIVTINNFFDSATIKNKSNTPFRLKNPDGRTLLCNIGRFSRQKNQAFLLELIYQLKKTSEVKFTLVLVGDGELKNPLFTKARELNLKFKELVSPMSSLEVDDEDVIFTGFMSNPLKLLKKCDLFLLPSLWEGFPLVAGEAMLCDVPVLLADFPTGAREMVGYPLYNSRIKLSEICARGLLLPPALSDNVLRWCEGIELGISLNNKKGNSMISQALTYVQRLNSTNSMQSWKEILTLKVERLPLK